MSTTNINKNSRGLRAELKVYDDFMVGKEEYEVTHKKNTFIIPSSMKDAMFEIL